MAKRGRRKKRKQNKVDLAVITMIVVSILLMFLIYSQSGVLGNTLSHILGGIMGWIKYLLPIGIFAIAIYIACDEREYLMSKLVQYSIFLLAIAIIMNVYQMSQGNLNINNEFSKVVQEAYELGEKNIGGGAVGAIAAVPLMNLLGGTRNYIIVHWNICNFISIYIWNKTY
ncbi:MAG: hypothetical protein IKT41_03460 [Clostridia bacterium]|nr:hypothetical protein [Clostridia bacterium]